MHELQTVYSAEDAVDLFGMLQVSDYNAWAVNEAAQEKAKQEAGL